MAKKIFYGQVVSDKMVNTVAVSIERKVPHPKYGKLIKKTQKFMVDTNGIKALVGQTVKIEEIKPMSKRKNFKLIGVVEKEGVQK